VSTVVLDLEGAYVASCGACPFTEAFASEPIAERRAAEHERRHVDREATLAHLEHARRAPPPVHAHLHSGACTTATCPAGDVWWCTSGTCCVIGLAGEPCLGHAIPTREKLVAASIKRRGR